MWKKIPHFHKSICDGFNFQIYTNFNHKLSRLVAQKCLTTASTQLPTKRGYTGLNPRQWHRREGKPLSTYRDIFVMLRLWQCGYGSLLSIRHLAYQSWRSWWHQQKIPRSTNLRKDGNRTNQRRNNVEQWAP